MQIFFQVIILISLPALAPLISHVAMHMTAVLVGIQTFSQLPPHY